MKLSAARVFVHDLKAAHDFYAARLGLRQTAGGAATGYCVYDAGTAQLVVEAVEPDAPEDEHALVGRFTGLSFAVADIAARFRELQALGIHFVAAPAKQGWGGMLATFTDPSDNQLQLVEDKDAS
jgi:predicted enzyme related to lactoylglutathione lyase